MCGDSSFRRKVLYPVLLYLSFRAKEYRSQKSEVRRVLPHYWSRIQQHRLRLLTPDY